MGTNPRKSAARHSFESLGLDDSALHPDHRGVGSIVRPQFGEDVLDSSLDGFFRDPELRRNLFVGVPGRDQTEDLDFSRSQGLICGVLGKLVRGLG